MATVSVKGLNINREYCSFLFTVTSDMKFGNVICNFQSIPWCGIYK